MSISLSFVRVIFLFLAVLVMTAFTTTTLNGGVTFLNAILGIASGLLFSGVLIVAETALSKFNLRAFNLTLLGLFIGFLMGQAVFLILEAVVDLSHLTLSAASIGSLRAATFLFTTYLGLIFTVKAADEISLSIPFVKFNPEVQKKKNILLDPALLSDPRLIDIASSGLLDQRLILARFAVKELLSQTDVGDEVSKAKVRKALEVVKRLENIPGLDLQYADNDFADIKDPIAKLIRLARLLDTNLITADINRIQQSTIESIDGIKIINITTLSNALKPPSQSGEVLNIKIQRYGKEPRQGVGYLEDGTMVVVNGGAEYIGETIKCHVLSVKHTTSGRMIFCNAPDVGLPGMEREYAPSVAEHSPKNYFAV